MDGAVVTTRYERGTFVEATRTPTRTTRTQRWEDVDSGTVCEPTVRRRLRSFWDAVTETRTEGTVAGVPSQEASRAYVCSRAYFGGVSPFVDDPVVLAVAAHTMSDLTPFEFVSNVLRWSSSTRLGLH